jgi:hypothetical protein
MTGTAFIAAQAYFSKAVLPFGTGIVVSPDKEYAVKPAITRPYLHTKPQWYELTIPRPERFLRLDQSLPEQPFPLVHALMSNQALSLLFAGERALTTWQAASFAKTKIPEEQKKIIREETAAFYHTKRKHLLALPTVSALCRFILEQSNTKEPSVISAFLSRWGISGIRFDEAGEERILLFDPRKDSIITAIHREAVPLSHTTIQGDSHE